MSKVLLVGNDINNETGSYSWSELIDDIIEKVGLADKISKEGKPFPMLYEEIYLNAAKNGVKESHIKSRIASNTRHLLPNEIHRRIVSLDADHILTTNYDLTLELCQVERRNSISNHGYIRENVYSLFRCHELGTKRIWHIHGSEVSPRSITLGYEHYGGYLQQMRNYVTSGTKGTYKKKDFLPLWRRIRDGKVEHHSWVDFFFTHDIHILGLNLDFVEMHLWWLLTYRSRAILERRFRVSNAITYYYPEKYQSALQYKLDLLQVNGVKVVPLLLRGNKRTLYYHRVLDEIEKV